MPCPQPEVDSYVAHIIYNYDCRNNSVGVAKFIEFHDLIFEGKQI